MSIILQRISVVSLHKFHILSCWFTMRAILRRIREVGVQYKINMTEYERGGGYRTSKKCIWFWKVPTQYTSPVQKLYTCICRGTVNLIQWIQIQLSGFSNLYGSTKVARTMLIITNYSNYEFESWSATLLHCFLSREVPTSKNSKMPRVAAVCHQIWAM